MSGEQLPGPTTSTSVRSAAAAAVFSGSAARAPTGGGGKVSIEVPIHPAAAAPADCLAAAPTGSPTTISSTPTSTRPLASGRGCPLRGAKSPHRPRQLSEPQRALAPESHVILVVLSRLSLAAERRAHQICRNCLPVGCVAEADLLNCGFETKSVTKLIRLGRH